MEINWDIAPEGADMLVQFPSGNVYFFSSVNECIYEECEWRCLTGNFKYTVIAERPKPVKVFGVEVYGVNEPLKVGEPVGDAYILNPEEDSGYHASNFSGDLEHILIKRGQVWQHEEDIQKVVKALGWVK